MLATNVFLLWYGIKLVQKTWYQIDRRVPARVGRRLLSAGADRRRDHGAVHRRALSEGQLVPGAADAGRRCGTDLDRIAPPTFVSRSGRSRPWMLSF